MPRFHALGAALSSRIRALGRGDRGPAVDPGATAEFDRYRRRAQAATDVMGAALNRGDPRSLDEAIALLTAVVDATPASHPDHVVLLANLGAALQTRFGRTRADSDMDGAIRALRRAMDAIPADRPDRAVLLSNLSAALRQRFERTGVGSDLDEAVTFGRQAVDATPIGDPDRAKPLFHLYAALRARFERTGAGSDLDEAVAIARQTVDATPVGDLDRAKHLNILGAMLQKRFERTRAHADLDEAVRLDREAVRLNREAVDITPAGHPDRAEHLFFLGARLRTRYQRSGAASDLDEAVAISRQAVDATPAGHPERARRLAHFGVSLYTRYERSRAGSDLDEAVTVSRQAVDATPAGHPDRAGRLSDLGALLQTRFRRNGTGSDLDEAVAISRQAVDATPAGHPDRATYLSNLGAALQVRFHRGGAPADLDEAIHANREAADTAPADAPDRVTYLSNLGAALRTRFEHTGTATDLDEAVSIGRRAAAASADHPNHAVCLSNLALTLRTRFERTGADADLDEALKSWTRARRSTVAPTTTRLNSAGFSATAVARWRGLPAAVEAYTEGVRLLPLLAWRGISRRDQQHLLRTHVDSLPRDGAACAIAAGRLDLAVELLEAGRGVYWSQLLDTRTDLTGLRQVAPGLAAELRDCRAVLDQPTDDHQPGRDEEIGLSTGEVVEARMRAARRFDELVEHVRDLPASDAFPHPDRFLATPSADTVLPGPDEDPIAVINISRWRCDALLLAHDGITPVALEDLTEEQVVGQAARYLLALQEFERSRHTSTDRLSLEMAITTTLEWLWDHVAGPVLDALGHVSTPTGRWPRLWWCPTGALTILPIHAAGHHHTTDTVLDRVVSSYTPTLRALARARDRGEAAQPAKILIVAVPDTPRQGRLPGAADERDLLTTWFARHSRTVLSDIEATRDNVMAHIGRHRWLHASCHGTQNLADPATGGLLPHDWATAGLITVTDLIDPANIGGEFAFLSACKTATSGVTNPDEAINLATAMQHAGWRHVIGTLWSIWDDSATTVTRDLYPQLLRDGHLDLSTVAHALHHTIRAMRDGDRARPSVWAPFIHTGP
jgi:tetratricopeptide (TPR) repeat protein